MKNYLMKSWIILFGFFCLFETKINVKITIYNYENHGNLMHNGGKCENFHWAGDHCDPMFTICVSGRSNCDLVYKTTKFWANKRYVYDILSTTIQSNYFLNLISMKIDVNDHDRYDEHDHIGVFRAKFFIGQSNFDRQLYMDYGPKNLNIRLKARVQISCAKNYYGQNCNTYCYPGYNYGCSQYDGTKICSKFYYGSDCSVHCIPGAYYSCSPKTGEKICKTICISQKACTYSKYKKTFLCECYINWFGLTCQTERLPYFSTASMKRTKLPHKIKSSQITKLTTTLMSKLTSSLPIFNNTLSRSKSYFLNKKSTVSLLLSTISSTIIKNSKHSSTLQTRSTKLFFNEITKPMTSTIYKKPSFLMKINNIEAAASNLKSLKNTDKEKSQNQGNSAILQVLYSIPIVLLALLLLCILLRYWKLKYKLKYLETVHTEIAPPVIYRRNLQFASNSEFPRDGNQDSYADLDSLYDSCTLTTNINDEVFYEEPVNKVINHTKYQNNF